MDYKEKLRLAKEAWDSGSYDRETIEYLFPELAEPEDERIRKEIISAIKEDWPGHEDWIAWLEKHGEQKSYASETMNEKGDFDNGFTRMMEKEQKPVENPCETCDHPMLNCQNFPCDKVGQNPEWSEEDINLREATIGLLNLIHPIDAKSWGKSRLDCIDWLKSLRPQKQWKPSEEQMNALNDVISSRDIKYDVLSELWKDLKKLK